MRHCSRWSAAPADTTKKHVPHPLRYSLSLALLATLWSAASLAASSTPVPAAASTAAPPQMPSPLAPQVRKFKHETLVLQRQATSEALAYGHPAYSRATLYLGVNLGDFVIHELTLRIDDGAPVHRHYSRKTAIVLIKHGLAPLGVFQTPPGTHRLTASVIYTRGKKTSASKPETLEKAFSFTKTQAPGQWVLHIDGAGFWGHTPELELTHWVPKS